MSHQIAHEGYILVTPAKDEEQSILGVARGILNQTITPRLWVIVDDGSKDKTPEVIEYLRNQQNWIMSIRLPEHPRDINLHYATVCKKGFDFAVGYSQKSNINYGFIGLVDADTVVEPRYFEELIGRFRNNKRLGIASGSLHYEKNGQLVPEVTDNTSPRGTGRLWSKECFFETGGYMLCSAPPDAVSNAKAIVRGYEVRQFRSIVAVQMRATSSAGGLWAGYEKKGRSWYYMNAHPVLVLMNMIHFTVQEPHYRGLAFFLGYVKSFMERSEKIGDEEIRNYYWNVRPRAAIRYALLHLED